MYAPSIDPPLEGTALAVANVSLLFGIGAEVPSVVDGFRGNPVGMPLCSDTTAGKLEAEASTMMRAFAVGRNVNNTWLVKPSAAQSLMPPKNPGPEFEP